MNGVALLAEFRKSRAEEAFTELVRRYAGLVYSVAKRRVGAGGLAEDVSQVVFTRLAKAPPKAKTDSELAGWLHRTALYVSIDVWRSETRRRAREEHAAAMQPAPSDSSDLWEQIAPSLDVAINELRAGDRQAVLLRFFEQKPMRDLGQALGVSEAAAKMRVGRAIEKLRANLAGKGITCSGAALSAFLLDRGLEAAPATLIDHWALTSLAGSTTAITVASTSVLGPIINLLSIMSKTKTALGLAGLVVVGIGLITVSRLLAPRDLSGGGNEIVVNATPGPNLAKEKIAGIGRPKPSDPAGVAVVADLEAVKQELRALLKTPPSSRSYPPPELTRILARFGQQVNEAIPILLEAVDVPDHETKVWALSGMDRALGLLRQDVSQRDRYQESFALARPTLGRVLTDENESGQTRMSALMSLTSSPIFVDGHLVVAAPLDEETSRILVGALLTSRGRDDGFRFTIADHFAMLHQSGSDEVQKLPDTIPAQLKAAKPEDRFIAAYLLAALPGDKPPEVKAELLRELNARSAHSYRAASALGKLGTDAADTVPDLVSYAEATKEWTSGYASAALEAACRLQPDLRERYPQIDEKLKIEEGLQSGVVETKSFAEHISELAKLGDDAMTRFLGIEHLSDPEQAKEQRRLLEDYLEREMQTASNDHRAALAKALDLVQKAPNSQEEQPIQSRPLSMENLLLDARVLLVDVPNANERQIEGALDQFRTEHMRLGGHSNVTSESYAILSKALGAIDPEFQVEWRKSVLKNYPWMDRVLPKETP